MLLFMLFSLLVGKNDSKLTGLFVIIHENIDTKIEKTTLYLFLDLRGITTFSHEASFELVTFVFLTRSDTLNGDLCKSINPHDCNET